MENDINTLTIFLKKRASKSTFRRNFEGGSIEENNYTSLVLFGFSLSPYFPDKVSDYERNTKYLKLMKILHDDIEYRLSEIPPKCDEYTTPESRSDKSNAPKWNKWHTKYPSRDRDQMTHDGDESPKEGIEILIF